jgi:hypothetical protein
VSIYLPLGKSGIERDQARIRWKNQLSRAERSLRDRGVDSDEIAVLLQPMRARLETEAPANTRSAARALLRSPGTFVSLELPEPTPALTFVGDRFYVRPLLPLVNINLRYRVLALSQNVVQLFEGNRYSLHRLPVPQLPRSLKDALRDDDDRHQTLQFHTGAAAGAGDRPAAFHGQVAGKEHSKERILRFCQLVDKAVTDYFGNQDVHLLLAAAEPLPGLYRQVNSYRNLHATVIPGDPRQLSESRIRQRAWELIEPQAERERAEALSRVKEGLAKARGTTDLSSVLDAAHEGRVAILFVNAEPGWPGSFSQPPGHRDRVSPSRTDDEDDMNRAIVETLRHGGRAFAGPGGQMPPGASIAALYRY